MRRSIFSSFAAALLATLAIESNATAHALGAECKIRGERVVVEAYFSDNTAAQEALVSVHDEVNRSIAEGKTDSNGRWSFPIPAAGRYEVIVEAGLGHRAAVPLTIEARRPSGTVQATTTVSEGPTRSDFTRFPWERLAGGILLIVIAAIAL